ncbi:MAG: NAD(P)-dependent oxidoreductase [Ramlibacter sp.]|nr:NAD(P)-dependent oxidoreductase [Ramlibacter sp.]
MHIGIAGTGKMGGAMARRLLGCKHRVTVWNRTRDKAEPLLALGAQWAATPAELAGMADLVISMVTDERALDDVYSGPQGLLEGAVKGKLLIDMSTVKPATQRQMAAKVNLAGAAYLECPVGGSVGPAQEGKLLGFVGGDSGDLERAREVLGQLCRRVEHVGPHGAGATMKLAINLPLMVYWQTLGEALSLIQPLGLDPARVVEIFSETSGGPNMLKVRGPMIAQALSGAKSTQVTVDVATMRKDMNAMLAQAQLQGRELPLTALALGCFERAAGAGLDQADCTQLPVWWLGSGGKA